MTERIAEWWDRVERPEVAVVATAAAVRLFWIAVVNAQPVSDFLFYFLRAGDLAAGRGYLFNGHPTAYWPPGYPIVLAPLFWLTGPNLLVVKLLNVLMWSVSTLCVYRVAKRVAGPTAALVAGLVVALYPEYVFFSGLVASENLFVLLMSIVALVLTVEPRTRREALLRGAAVGGLVGWGMVTRPASVLLAPFLVVVVLVARRRSFGLLTAVAMVLAVAVAVAPWMIRNRIVLGEVVLATNGGASVWGGAHEGTTGTFLPADQRPEWMRPALTLEQELRENREGTKAATAYMLSHPVRWLAVAPTKLLGLFAEPGGLMWNIVYDQNGQPGGRPLRRSLGPVERQVVRVSRLPEHLPGMMIWIQALEWILGAAGLVVAVVGRRKAAVWPLAIVVYWVLFQITFSTGQPRYLVSVGPLVAPGIGVLVALALRRSIAVEAVEAEPVSPETAEEVAAL